MPQIHPTAIVASSARVAGDVQIGPYSIVEDDVTIGPGCRVGGHVTLGEHLILGRNARIFNYACVGTASQDLKHRGEASRVEIGDDVIIREFVTVNRGTREGGVTRVGDRVALLAYAHVAHECVVEDDAVLVNAATLGGEVVVGRRAIIGGLTGIHQFCRVGAFAIIGAGSKVTQDVPPFLLADGHPARPYGPNKIGLQRAGFRRDQIDEIRRAYRVLFDRDETLETNLYRLARHFPDSQLAAEILDFCRRSTRGIARPRSRHARPVNELALEDLPDWHS